MAARLLVCISATGATVALWKGRLFSCLRFENEDNGEAEFAEMLKGLQELPVSIMIDTVDEDYRIETVPHVRGRDRRELLDRKLRQTYRTAPFVAARLQTRARGGRGRRSEDDYLLAAVTESQIAAPWISAIAARDLPIAGVFAAPTVMPAAVKPLKLDPRRLILVSRHAAGLRQTFLRDGEFRFSRLTPLRGPADGTTLSAFGAEIVNTRMYLNALQVTTPDEVVDVVILDQDDRLAGLYDAVAIVQGPVRARRIGREELSLRLKLPEAILDASADVLPLHLLASATPSINLAPATLRDGHVAYRAGRWLLGAAAGVAAIGAVTTMLDLRAEGEVEAEAAKLASQTSLLRARYDELTRQFPQSPANATRLKQAVDAFEAVRARARTPESLFDVLEGALESQPTVVLGSVAWRHGRFTDAASQFTNAGTRTPGSGPLRQAGFVTGEIAPFNGDYRTAVATIRDFAEQLRRHPRVAEARILKLPLDDSSRESVTGSTAVRTERQLGARFEILITLREDAGAS